MIIANKYKLSSIFSVLAFSDLRLISNDLQRASRDLRLISNDLRLI